MKELELIINNNNVNLKLLGGNKMWCWPKSLYTGYYNFKDKIYNDDILRLMTVHATTELDELYLIKDIGYEDFGLCNAAYMNRECRLYSTTLIKTYHDDSEAMFKFPKGSCNKGLIKLRFK